MAIKKADACFYVYEHWRPDTGVCFYVGKGKGQRAYSTQTRNPHHKNITNKLSNLGLTLEVRFIRKNLDEKSSYALERKRISFWKRKGVTLVNYTDGGEGQSWWLGKKRPLSTRKKLSAAATKRMKSKMVRDNLSLMVKRNWKNPKIRARTIAGIRKGHSAPSVRKKLRNAALKLWSDRGEDWTMPKSTRLKISKARLGNPLSMEHRAKLKAAWIRRKAA